MNTKIITVIPENFTRVNSDSNGNQRYTINFKKLLSENDIYLMNRNGSIDAHYRGICKQANNIGGRKYTATKFGGLIVFKTDSLNSLCERINEHFSK